MRTTSLFIGSLGGGDRFDRSIAAAITAFAEKERRREAIAKGKKEESGRGGIPVIGNS